MKKPKLLEPKPMISNAASPPPPPKPSVERSIADTAKDMASFAFPTKVRCPRCRSLETKRTGQRGGVQYRECLAPICRGRFRVVGQKL